MNVKKLLPIILALCIAFSLSGCFFMSVDELYALPKHSDEYNNLQKAIDSVITADLQYSAPISGQNQQAIQLVDLDGDGEEEAVVFCKSNGDRPLKAYIFDLLDDQFENVAVIEGDGNAFESVEYVQLDGVPGLDIVLGRQISDQVLHSMSAYALYDNRVVELMSANYTEYTTVDLDLDGRTDIIVLRTDSEERNGIVELYRYRNEQMERAPEARLSTGTEFIRRIVTGMVDTDTPAVFVASTFEEDGLVTDVFAMKDGVFRNITSSADSGTSIQTVRSYYVYATDIDSDGIIEMPRLEKLPSSAKEKGDYWVIHWYQLKLSGETVDKLTTYHNYAAGWYFIIPEQWGTSFTVSRGDDVSGTRGYVFSKWNSETRQEDMIFTLYAFTGDDRAELAVSDGRFLLGEKGDVLYSAAMGQCDWAEALSHEELMRLFNFVHVDWNTGEK